ncbi:MAG: phenylacetate-CoA oxygenase/reductase subunit PaaK [Bacteroidetes bacterium]|nr:phenylacetate-CoA oxygenase/reductase subunit PaaK [Bacteroidota bacterium]
MASHFRPLKIKNIRTETADCVSVSFDVPEELKNEFEFKHGQNITVKAVIDGEEIRRSYSICSSPLENELRIAVKKVSNGKFSSYANGYLKKDHVLEVLAPSGQFFTELNPSNKKNYLAFAAGSGITPIISIIKTTLAKEPQSSFALIYGNRTHHSIIFREELEALKNSYMDRFSLHYILSREKTDAPLNQGRIDTEKCEALFKNLLNKNAIDDFFICGPEEMTFSIKNWLEAKGIDKRKIHFELFTVPGQHAAMNRGSAKGKSSADKDTNNIYNSPVSKINIKLDGITFGFDLAFNGEPILDAALKQGADLPFACKGGVCATCRAKLLSGKVEMDNNYALQPEELEAGFILTCQSHPRTEEVMIDFDVKG